MNYCIIQRTLLKTEKQKLNLLLTQYAFCFNAYCFFVEGGRGRGRGLIREEGLIKKLNLQTGGLLELLQYLHSFNGANKIMKKL